MFFRPLLRQLHRTSLRPPSRVHNDTQPYRILIKVGVSGTARCRAFSSKSRSPKAKRKRMEALEKHKLKAPAPSNQSSSPSSHKKRSTNNTHKNKGHPVSPPSSSSPRAASNAQWEALMAQITAAAEKGCAQSQNRLGDCERQGLGVKINPEAAAEWYRLAAEQANPEALYNLGHCFRNGFGVQPSGLQAQSLWERAAELGHFGSMVILAELLMDAAEGTRAKDWLTPAAEAGHTAAQLHLSHIYGEGMGDIAQDDALAFTWSLRAAREAAAEDPDRCRAFCRLASLYVTGQGTVVNEVEARKCYEAVLHQDITGEVHCMLGSMYNEGSGGLEQDAERFIELLKKSAGLGFGAAQNLLEELGKQEDDVDKMEQILLQASGTKPGEPTDLRELATKLGVQLPEEIYSEDPETHRIGMEAVERMLQEAEVEASG